MAEVIGKVFPPSEEPLDFDLNLEHIDEDKRDACLMSLALNFRDIGGIGDLQINEGDNGVYHFYRAPDSLEGLN
jgi:hypothetical protein